VASVARAGRVWRWLVGIDPSAIDALLAVALGAGAVAQLVIEGQQTPQTTVSALGSTLPLAWRRRYPLAMYLIQIALDIFGARQPDSISLLATFIGLYSVAVYSRYRWAPVAIPIIGAIILAALVPESSPSVPSWALELVGGLAVWLAGNTVRQRQAQSDALAERAERLERERELTTQLVLADERQRIARELHDIVAHSVSVMVVQAGAARTLVEQQPRQAIESMLAVERSGREALAELRRLLGLLTDTTMEPALAPQPGLSELERLVERVEQVGQLIDVQIVGTPRPLPAGIDLTAYRVLQEALTNALKYARGARTEVVVEYEHSELRLSVLDHGGAETVPASGAGRGLVGMQERVAVYGGHLEAHARAGGGFQVLARLPLQPA
jgi:signal transduction histidine kinase